MYCQNCGAHMEPDETFCPECGWTASKANKDDTNVLAILGFIFSIVSIPAFGVCIFSISGLVLSILGLVKVKKEGFGQKGLAIAGIIISVITLILFIGGAVFILALLSELGTWAHYYY